MLSVQSFTATEHFRLWKSRIAGIALPAGHLPGDFCAPPAAGLGREAGSCDGVGMPSPLGHALAGAAIGWALGPGRRASPSPSLSRWPIWTTGAAFGVLAAVPDLDLLWPGAHRGPSHSVGAACLVGAAALAATRDVRLALVAACAFGSHALLDWLGTDSSPPVGLMALWPFSRDYYESGLHVFAAISRRYWLPGFWRQNIQAVAWEMAVLLPIALAALRRAWLSSGRTPGRSSARGAPRPPSGEAGDTGGISDRRSPRAGPP